MPSNKGQTITVGVTGASGAVFAQKTLAMLEDDSRVRRIHLVLTETGQRLFAEELRITSGDLKKLPGRVLGRTPKKIEVLSNKDVGASIASGSYSVDAMIVIPCTVGALASIACGTCDDLMARSADVMLKEGRKLILCVRDTPLNRIHLENMLRAQAAGALRGDDAEPHCGFALRQGESTHEDAGVGHRGAFDFFRMDVYAPRRRGVFRCRVAIESTGAEAGASGDCGSLFLFVHEAVHQLVSSVPGVCPGHFSSGSLDCDYRWARLADADSLRRSYAVGWRL